MSCVFRRAARSRATRTASALILGVTLGVPAASAAPAPPRFQAEGTCAGSTVTREYTPEAMTLRLHLDLDGCHWWDGSARNLMIWLTRDDGNGPASRYQNMACESGSDADSRTSTCEIFASLAHPLEEKSVSYLGEATWKWKDGTRRVSFDTHCSTVASESRCDDPVATWHE
jgi:hypothetical protein